MKITSNRKAYFEYSILESFDAGIKLIGNEVKSIRRSDVTIADSFVYKERRVVYQKHESRQIQTISYVGQTR